MRERKIGLKREREINKVNKKERERNTERNKGTKKERK